MKHSTLLSTILVSSSILGFADPLPEPAPKISSATTGFNLDWDGTNGNTYFIEYSSDLMTWQYMPVIESGTGSPLGYGFGSPDDRLFLRLKYTDVATGNALTDDFDGDGISNWNEVRIGGSETNPFLWDTDGNGISDGLEDRDGDGTSDVDENSAGTDPDDSDDGGRNDPNVDTDEDGITNAFDADHNDKAVVWKRSPETSYAVIELGKPDESDEDKPWGGCRLGEGTHVIMNRAAAGYEYWSWLGEAPPKSAFETYVWDLATVSWTELFLPDYLRGTGSDIDSEGNIYGFGYGALGINQTWPGTKRVTLRWQKFTGGWNMADTEKEPGLGAAFSSGDGTWAPRPERLEIAPTVFGKTGRFVCRPSGYPEDYGVGHAYMYRLGGDDTEAFLESQVNEEAHTDISISDYKQAGELGGWHTVIWTKTTEFTNPAGNNAPDKVEKKHVFSRLTADSKFIDNTTPEEESRLKLAGLASIHSDYRTDGIHDIVIWSTTDGSFLTGTNETSDAALTWLESTRLDASQRLGGKINSRGEGLKDNKLWRNGKWQALTTFIDTSKWTNIRGVDINSRGCILVKVDEVVAEGEEGSLILLLPVDLDVDNNGNYNDIVDGVAKYLPGYVGNDSKLDDGASFDEASYAGAQAMRIRIPGLKADKATFEIADVSKHKGYSGNGIDDSLVAGNDEDFSFAADTNFIDEEGERKIEATVDSTGIWAPIYCKDYGAWCEIEITLKKEDGTTLGEPLKITLPADVNGDKLADHWQKEQVKDWNKQYNLIIGDEKWADPERPGTWAVVFGDTHSADRDAQDMELADSDGPRGNPVAIMKADGDGLKSIDEYRGYFLDGGPNITTPRHSRLSVARKELLVECSEAVDIKDAVNNGTGTNPAISAYDFTSMMVNVSNFYRDPDKGAEIDLYWCRDDFKKITDKYTYEVDLERTYDAFFENGQGHYIGSPADPDTVTTGGNTIYFDQRWRDESPEDHDEVYSSDALSLLKKSRDDDQLQHFVKLFLGHRRAIVSHGETGRHLRLNSQLAFSGDTADYDRNGSLVFVSGIADESYFGVWESEVGSMVSVPLYSEVRFTEILDYLVAHELGHLLMNAANTQGFNGSEHTAESYGGLMAEDGYTKSLNILKFKAIEINNIDLRNRASIKP